jgi:hypothetical protein
MRGESSRHRQGGAHPGREALVQPGTNARKLGPTGGEQQVDMGVYADAAAHACGGRGGRSTPVQHGGRGGRSTPVQHACGARALRERVWGSGQKVRGRVSDYRNEA